MFETAGAKPGENVCERFVYVALFRVNVLSNVQLFILNEGYREERQDKEMIVTAFVPADCAENETRGQRRICLCQERILYAGRSYNAQYKEQEQCKMMIVFWFGTVPVVIMMKDKELL